MVMHADLPLTPVSILTAWHEPGSTTVGGEMSGLHINIRRRLAAGAEKATKKPLGGGPNSSDTYHVSAESLYRNLMVAQVISYSHPPDRR